MAIKSIVHGSIVYICFDILNKSIPFVLVLVLTHYLAPAEMGIVAEFTAFIGILSVFCGLSVIGFLRIAFFQVNVEEMGGYVFNAMIILLSSTFITFLVVLGFEEILRKYIHIPGNWLYYAVMTASFQFMSSINLVLWQAEKKPFNYGIFQFLNTVTGFSLSLLFVVALGLNWQGRLGGQVIATALFFLISIIVLWRRQYLKIGLNSIIIKKSLKFGVPLIPHTLSSWIFTGYNIIAVGSVLGKDHAGIYSVAVQLSMVMSILINGVNNAIVPFFFEQLRNISGQGKKRLVRYIYFGFGTTIIAGLLVWKILFFATEYLIDERYNQARELLIYLIGVHVFKGMYLFVAKFILYKNKTYLLTVITLFIAIVHVLLIKYFVHTHGVNSVAVITFLSGALIFFMIWLASSKVYPMPWFQALRIKNE